jgi:WhiB family transcriptional regulator, redox-sensing transcriptional regulator
MTAPLRTVTPDWDQHPDRACYNALVDFDDTLPRSRTINEAKALCHTCPVSKQCLDFANARPEAWGVWGGYTTTERMYLRQGYKPRRCENCGVLFVSHRTRLQCFPCYDPGTTRQDLEDYAEEIADLFTQGVSDDDIADRLSDQADRYIAPAAVKRMRLRLRIVHNRHGTAGKTGYDPINVELVWAGRMKFGELTRPEQVELLRQWLNIPDNHISGFATNFQVSWYRCRQLRNLLPDNRPARTPPVIRGGDGSDYRHYRTYYGLNDTVRAMRDHTGGRE